MYSSSSSSRSIRWPSASSMLPLSFIAVPPRKGARRARRCRRPSQQPCAAVHVERLAGDEVARARGEEDDRSHQVLRVLVALEGARLPARREIFLGEHAPLVLVSD